MPSQDTLTVPELAAVLDVSVRTAWRRVHDGIIPSQKEGGRVFIDRPDLEHYLAHLPTAAKAS